MLNSDCSISMWYTSGSLVEELLYLSFLDLSSSTVKDKTASYTGLKGEKKKICNTNDGISGPP